MESHQPHLTLLSKIGWGSDIGHVMLELTQSLPWLHSFSPVHLYIFFKIFFVNFFDGLWSFYMIWVATTGINTHIFSFVCTSGTLPKPEGKASKRQLQHWKQWVAQRCFSIPHKTELKTSTSTCRQLIRAWHQWCAGIALMPGYGVGYGSCLGA